MSSNYDIFVCYNSKDLEHVTSIVEVLRQKGLAVLFDKDSFPPGQSWTQVLDKYIPNIHVSAILLGNNGIGTRQEKEIYMLLEQECITQHILIPVVLSDVKTMPQISIWLRDKTRLDITQQGFLHCIETLVKITKEHKTNKKNNTLNKTKKPKERPEFTLNIGNIVKNSTIEGNIKAIGTDDKNVSKTKIYNKVTGSKVTGDIISSGKIQNNSRE